MSGDHRTQLAVLLAGLTAAILGSPGVPAQGPEPAPTRAVLDVDVPSRTAWQGQALPVRVQFQIDREFFASAAIQPFQRQLDVPVQLRADWLRELRGAELVLPTGGAGPTFALGERVVSATAAGERTLDGRAFTAWTFEARLLVREPGAFVLPATTLHFAWATRFCESLLSGRQPEDRHDGKVEAPPIAITVQPLPALGRPADFTGAIGTFTITGELQPATLAVGATGKLSLHVRGDGDLRFAAPKAPLLPGWDVLGMLESTTAERRTFTWDVVPRVAGNRPVPPLRLPTFDPIAGAWRTLATDPIPAAVTGGAATGAPIVSSSTPGAVVDLRAPIPADQVLAHGQPVTTTQWLLALLLPWLGAASLWTWRSWQERRRRDPLGARARAAAAAFAATLARPDADATAAFTEYLAARLRSTNAAVVGPDLGDRLQRAGLAAPLAVRTAAAFDALVAARYGGNRAAADLPGLVRELEAAFAAAEGRA